MCVSSLSPRRCDAVRHGGLWRFQGIYSRRAWIFGALVLFNLFNLFDLADTALKGVEHFASLGLQYPIRMGAFIALNIVAAITRSERFHAAFAVANAVYHIPWAIVTFATMD